MKLTEYLHHKYHPKGYRGVDTRNLKWKPTREEKDAAKRVRTYYDSDNQLHLQGDAEDVALVHGSIERLNGELESRRELHQRFKQ